MRVIIITENNEIGYGLFVQEDCCNNKGQEFFSKR
jgi:hypothetical protein